MSGILASFWRKYLNICLFLHYLILGSSLVAGLWTRNARSDSSGPAIASNWTDMCPCRVCDIDQFKRRRVICDEGGKLYIPCGNMDKSAQVLIFTAPPDNPNQVIIGRIFLDFDSLVEICITHSNVPAIGDSSFWPGKSVQSLDLSLNNITILRDMDFNGLSNLISLNLSHNKLEGSPSAPFRFLTNLTRLSLASNKLTNLVPRLFYRLDKLEFLDLSGNPLQNIEPEDFKDVKTLRTLLLAECQLKKLHSLIYQNLPNLESLDLRYNLFDSIRPEEFKHLKKLKSLHLDGNKLTVIEEYTFSTLRLKTVSLSGNGIVSLMGCAFCNASVIHLDLSNNKFLYFQTEILDALSNSLMSLNVENNMHLKEPTTSVFNLIAPLKHLRTISLSSMNLDDTLPISIFTNQRQSLASINLSRNKFVNISSKLFEGLSRLEVLDLSSNEIYSLSEALIETLTDLKSLTLLYLDLNRWSCFQCHVTPLLEWLRSSPTAYVNACEKQEKSFSSCVVCASPKDLKGKQLHTMDAFDLEWCADPSLQLRVSTTEPNVGLVLALLIIISLVIVIIAVIILYRKQGATYYTHEDELRFDDKTIFSVSNAVQQFADATASPPVSPESTRSIMSSSSSSPSTQSRASQSPHSTPTQSSLPQSSAPPSSPPCQSLSQSSSASTSTQPSMDATTTPKVPF